MTNHTDTNSTACAEGMGCDNPNHTSLTCYEKYYQLEYEGPGSQVIGLHHLEGSRLHPLTYSREGLLREALLSVSMSVDREGRPSGAISDRLAMRGR
jgi:hypothetical protein